MTINISSTERKKCSLTYISFSKKSGKCTDKTPKPKSYTFRTPRPLKSLLNAPRNSKNFRLKERMEVREGFRGFLCGNEVKSEGLYILIQAYATH